MAEAVLKKYKVAAVQAAPEFLDLDKGVAKAIKLIAEAAQNGAKLIAFPEVWLPGYPWWIWLDSPAWGMQFVQRHYENALVIGSPQWDKLCQAAAKHKIFVVLGFCERDGSSLYIAQATIDDQGKVVSTRRKLKPTHAERTVYGEGDGSHLSVHSTSIGRIGALSCAEHIQPLSKYAMYAQNEQVHVAAWPSFSVYRGAAFQLSAEANLAASQVYALEGGCYVLAPCGVVSKEMLDMLADTPNKRQLLLEGGGFAQIFGPDSMPLCEPIPETEDGVLYADIDLGVIGVAKAAYDPQDTIHGQTWFGYFSIQSLRHECTRSRLIRRTTTFKASESPCPPRHRFMPWRARALFAMCMREGESDLNSGDTLLSLVQVSQVLGIPRAVVRQLVKAGAFGPVSRNRSGHYRVFRQRVLRFNTALIPPPKARRGALSNSEMFWLYDQDFPQPPWVL